MITKRFFKTKDEVEVTFDISIPEEVEGVSVVCDATEWKSVSMRPVAGRWRARVRLPVDKQVQFRYLASGGIWITDGDADGYFEDDHGNRNAVVDTHRP